MSTSADGAVVQPAAGVIHDIGYRHYDDSRLGRSAVVRALYVDSLRGAFGLGRSAKSKVMPFLLLAVICVPALVVAIALNVTPQDEFPFDLTSYAFFVYIPLSLYVAGQAPASVSRDLRFRVVSLYFSRPLRRGDYVAAKYAAMATAVFAILTVPLLLLTAGGLLASFPAGDTLRQLGQALVGAAVTAPVLGGIGLLIASVTPRRGLGVAAVIAVLRGHHRHPERHAGPGRLAGPRRPRDLDDAHLPDRPCGHPDGVAVRHRVDGGGDGAGRRAGTGLAGLRRGARSPSRTCCCSPATARCPSREGRIVSTIVIDQVSRWYGNVVAVNDVTHDHRPRRHRPARSQRRRQVHADLDDGGLPRPLLRHA